MVFLLYVLDYVADVVFATTLLGNAVGQLIKLVSTRKSIGVIIEVTQSLLSMSWGRSAWLVQCRTRSDRNAENRYQSPFALETGLALRVVLHARENIAGIVKVRLSLAHLAMSASDRLEHSVERTEPKM